MWKIYSHPGREHKAWVCMESGTEMLVTVTSAPYFTIEDRQFNPPRCVMDNGEPRKWEYSDTPGFALVTYVENRNKEEYGRPY